MKLLEFNLIVHLVLNYHLSHLKNWLVSIKPFT